MTKFTTLGPGDFLPPEPLEFSDHEIDVEIAAMIDEGVVERMHELDDDQVRLVELVALNVILPTDFTQPYIERLNDMARERLIKRGAH